MSEAAPVTPATPPAENQPQAPWSEKYADQSAFEKGFREITTKLGAPITRPLLGDGGIYETPEAAWAGYKVYETALGKRTPAAPASKPAEQAPAQNPEAKPDLKIPEVPATIENVDQILTSAGLDVNAIADTFLKNGKLDDASYKALESKGYGRAVVDQFIAGQRAIAESEQRSIQAAQAEAGGPGQLESLLKWAASGVDKAEHADFNRRLNDPSLRIGAIKDLKLRYAAASGTSGSKPLVSGQTPSGKTYPKSHAEFMKWTDEARAGKRQWTDLAVPAEVRAGWEQ